MTLLLALLAPLLQERDLSGKCGSEIPWTSSVEEAAAQARESKRLILWYVPTVENTAMDRKQVIDDYMRTGPWMMRDVVDLVRRRFVPLRMGAGGPLAKRLGISRLEFIEPGVVFLTPDLKVVHAVDRISTFQEDWFVALLRGALAASPEAGQEPSDEESLKAAATPYARAQVLRRMKRGEDAAKELEKAGGGGDVACERGSLLLKQGKHAEALASFESVKDGTRADEAAYLKGAVLHNLNRDVEGRGVWKELVARSDSPWAWKASAELRRIGPFVRGFEELSWLAPGGVEGLPRSTTLARPPEGQDLVVKRSVALLLRTQRANGSWDDSNYNFGGEDSLPNVYMAVTALSAKALLAWKEADPAGVQAALDRAWPYLTDEKNMATDDQDEIVWGYAYRLRYFAALAAADAEKRGACVKKMNELVGFLVRLQKKNGIWRHEYEAPFTTATVIQALVEAKEAGADVPAETLKHGAEALATCRNGKGVFSYAYPAQPAPVEGSAGRMPLCELGLFLCGKSDPQGLRAAVDASFDRHALLEKVRKYDDHADRFHNGGFFFWFDMLGRAEAVRRLAADRNELLDKQRGIVLSIPEIDGGFVDSHELGKCYGTAMGLLTLRACQK